MLPGSYVHSRAAFASNEPHDMYWSFRQLESRPMRPPEYPLMVGSDKWFLGIGPHAGRKASDLRSVPPMGEKSNIPLFTGNEIQHPGNI